MSKLIANNYYKLYEIGSGAFGSVFKCYHLNVETKEKTMCAIKRINRIDKDSINELNIMKRIANECGKYCVLIKDSFKYDGRMYIVMEYLDEFITMKTFIRNNDISLEDKGYARIIDRLIKGLISLHSFYITHGDIKSANVMIHPLRKEIRYIDFGGSYYKYSEDQSSIHFTVKYIDPKIYIKKILKDKNYGSSRKVSPRSTSDENKFFNEYKQSDMYSLGVLIYELINGKTPYDLNKSKYEIYDIDLLNIKLLNDKETTSNYMYNYSYSKDINRARTNEKVSNIYKYMAYMISLDNLLSMSEDRKIQINENFRKKFTNAHVETNIVKTNIDSSPIDGKKRKSKRDTN